MTELYPAPAAVDDDEVDTDRYSDELVADGARAGQAGERTVQPADLVPIDPLLGRPEGRGVSAPDFDDDRRCGWPGIETQQVDLVAPDADVTGDDLPTGREQVPGGLLLAGGAATLA